MAHILNVANFCVRTWGIIPLHNIGHYMDTCANLIMCILYDYFN